MAANCGDIIRGTQIPIAHAAPPTYPSRGFLPWRFADAGPAMRGTTFMGPASENLHRSGHQPADNPRSIGRK